MNNRWLDRWRMRRVIAHLAIPLNNGSKSGVHDFAKTMEATEIMTRGSKPSDKITMTTTRENLTQFIRYMTSMHDTKLNWFATARVGLATIMAKDENAIGGNREEVLREEFAKTQAGTKLKVVDQHGRKLKVTR
ncbi:MAG: hypothetical protein GWP61_24355 [Chloroflexi bacterium]|nr:hypothetical protein [Chloroflexota bacterium]